MQTFQYLARGGRLLRKFDRNAETLIDHLDAEPDRPGHDGEWFGLDLLNGSKQVGDTITVSKGGDCDGGLSLLSECQTARLRRIFRCRTVIRNRFQWKSAPKAS